MIKKPNIKLFSKKNLINYIFILFILFSTIFTCTKIIQNPIDKYEIIILIIAIIGVIFLGLTFPPFKIFTLTTIVLAYINIYLYNGNINNVNQHIILKFILSGKSIIFWQYAFIWITFFCYTLGDLVSYNKKNNDKVFFKIALYSGWISALTGFVGLINRWHESYLLSTEYGHIPISNLYEVFILFMVIISLMYAYYSYKYKKGNLYKIGAFVYFLQFILSIFMLWYSIEEDANTIQPLIPALQSWWMKIHVPANFIGYGGFCLAAMVGIAQLLSIKEEERIKKGLSKNKFLPSPNVLEELMYKLISIGFLFFSIATILGSLWAADAWGKYWSWDPKETWAFIVWLNYAIWLHLRLIKDWHGKILAWWAVLGFFVTAYAFLGVNLYGGGLHSYGNL